MSQKNHFFHELHQNQENDAAMPISEPWYNISRVAQQVLLNDFRVFRACRGPSVFFQ